MSTTTPGVPDTILSSASRQSSVSTRSRSDRGPPRPRGPSPAPTVHNDVGPTTMTGRASPDMKKVRERSRSRDAGDRDRGARGSGEPAAAAEPSAPLHEPVLPLKEDHDANDDDDSDSDATQEYEFA
eukprot:5848036-Pyramimonas_sp.AAC.1